MSTSTRVYLVRLGDRDRLVRATHRSNALMHVALDVATVKVPTQDELIACLNAGTRVETMEGEQQVLPACMTAP